VWKRESTSDIDHHSRMSRSVFAAAVDACRREAGDDTSRPSLQHTAVRLLAVGRLVVVAVVSACLQLGSSLAATTGAALLLLGVCYTYTASRPCSRREQASLARCWQHRTSVLGLALVCCSLDSAAASHQPDDDGSPSQVSLQPVVMVAHASPLQINITPMDMTHTHVDASEASSQPLVLPINSTYASPLQMNITPVDISLGQQQMAQLDATMPFDLSGPLPANNDFMLMLYTERMGSVSAMAVSDPNERGASAAECNGYMSTTPLFICIGFALAVLAWRAFIRATGIASPLPDGLAKAVDKSELPPPAPVAEAAAPADTEAPAKAGGKGEGESSDDDAPAPLPTGVWWALAFMTLTAWVADLYYAMISTFLPAVARQRGASSYETNFIIACQPIGMMCVSAVMPWVMKLRGFNAHQLVCQATMFNAATIAATGLAERHTNSRASFVIFLSATRLLQGAVCAVQEVCIETIVLRMVPERLLAVTVASFSSLRQTSVIFGPSFGGFLYQLGCWPLPFLTSSALLVFASFVMSSMFSKATLQALRGKAPQRDISPWQLLMLPGVWLLQLMMVPPCLGATLLEPLWSLFLGSPPFNMNSAAIGGFFLISTVCMIVALPLGALLGGQIGYFRAFSLGLLVGPLGYLLQGPSPLLGTMFPHTLGVITLGLVFTTICGGIAMACVQPIMLAVFKAADFTQEEIAGVWASLTFVTTSIMAAAGPMIGAAMYEAFPLTDSFPLVTTTTAGVTWLIQVPCILVLAKRFGNSGIEKARQDAETKAAEAREAHATTVATGEEATASETGVSAKDA
jgi:DHA1 family solute carrier family 18 vesicular amine transporter 1/2